MALRSTKVIENALEKLGITVHMVRFPVADVAFEYLRKLLTTWGISSPKTNNVAQKSELLTGSLVRWLTAAHCQPNPVHCKAHAASWVRHCVDTHSLRLRRKRRNFFDMKSRASAEKTDKSRVKSASCELDNHVWTRRLSRHRSLPLWDTKGTCSGQRIDRRRGRAGEHLNHQPGMGWIPTIGDQRCFTRPCLVGFGQRRQHSLPVENVARTSVLRSDREHARAPGGSVPLFLGRWCASASCGGRSSDERNCPIHCKPAG